MEVVVFLALWPGLWWWGARRRAVDAGGMGWRRTWVGVLAFLAATMVTAGVGTHLYGFALAMLGAGALLIYALRAQGDRWRGIPSPVLAPPGWMKPRPPDLPQSPGVSLAERLHAAYERRKAELAGARVASEVAALRRLGSPSRPAKIYLDPEDFGLDEDDLELLGPASRPALQFVYEDANGNQSIRTVSHWKKDGSYIHGFCHDALGVRTFRRDRVLEWLGGTGAGL